MDFATHNKIQQLEAQVKSLEERMKQVEELLTAPKPKPETRTTRGA